VIEEWRDVVGYEGLYQVSNLGNVKSLKRVVKHSSGCPKIINEKFLKPSSAKYGHKNVVLSLNGIKKHQLVHRLVAKAFIENPNNYPCVNHKDENAKNNCIDNLEWCTVQYNNTYGTFVQRRIQNTDFSKRSLTAKKYILSVAQMDLSGKVLKVWDSLTDAAMNTGTQISKICSCCKGQRKTSNGYMWKYKEAV
jgi:hypothetical protein